jgi:hypothetical protein
MSSGGSFINAPGGVFNATNPTDSLMISGGSSYVFTNQGTVNVNVLNTFTVNIQFHNEGTVNVAQGTFVMGQKGTHTGEFNHCSGCFINFSGGVTHVLTEESIVTDGRGIIFSASSTTVSGIFEPQYFQQAGSISSSTVFTNLYTSTDTIVITGGTLDFRGSAVLANVELSGSLSKFVANSENSEVNITDSFIWQGPNCDVGGGSGKINFLSSCRSTINGSNPKIGALVTNYGQMDCFSRLVLQTGGSLINAPGAVFNVVYPSNGISSLIGSGLRTFTNQGTLNVSHSFMVDVPFNNEGTVNVTQGTLTMRAGGNHWRIQSL